MLTSTNFSITAGVLIRGQVRRGIESFCAERGIRVIIEEDRKLTGSRFRIYVTGQEYDIMALIDTVKDIESSR